MGNISIKKKLVSVIRRLWKLIIMDNEVRNVEKANANDNMNEEIEVIDEMDPVATENIEEVERVAEARRVYGKKSYDKYSFEVKYALALEGKSCKMSSYDEEVESMTGKTLRERHVQSTPKGGYLTKAVRSFYSNMTKIKSDSHEMRNATKFATRCYEKLEAGDFGGVKAKRFRSVGDGRK